MNNQVNVTTKKKKARFNIIDLLLILIVIAMIATMIYLFVPGNIFENLSAEREQEIQYTVEILGVDQDFINNIKENDNVIDVVSKASIGTVMAVSYDTNYSELKYNEESGEGIMVSYPDKYNLIVTISAEALYNAGEGYSVDGCRIAVGEKLSLRFPDYSCEAYCIDVPRP